MRHHLHHRRQSRRQARCLPAALQPQACLAPQVLQPQVQLQDDVGWTEVRRTKRKFKRELTVEEMDARERQRETKQDDGEFNTQLFESNRHDHDRV